MIFKDKKGGERGPVSLYWFLLWVIALGGISLIVFAFSSYTPDIRLQEAEILTQEIRNCIIENGEVKDIWAQDIEKECGIDLKKEGKYAYHLSLGIYSYESCNQGVCQESGKEKELKRGDENLAALCSIKEAKGNVPQCYEEYAYVIQQGKPRFLGIKIAVS